MIASNKFPPELNVYPRRVKLREPGSGCAMWGMRLFILPHTLIGIAMLLAIPGRIIWTLAAHDSTATAIELSISYHKGTNYSMKYQYSLGGKVHTSSRSITNVQYNQLLGRTRVSHNVAVIHTTVPMRILGTPPLGYAEAILPGDSNASTLVMIAVFALFWNGIVFVFVYILWIMPLRIRSLYKHGEPVTGTITDKKMVSGKQTTYYLHYEFDVPNFPHVVAKNSVSGKQWSKAAIGETVTVLHFQGKVKPSVVYEYGAYQCVG